MAKVLVADLRKFRDERGNDIEIRSDGTASVVLHFHDDPGLTEQSHKDDCDLNNIIARYVRSGVPITINEKEFVDLTQMVDYQTAFNTVKTAQDLFMSLSADIRKTFEHSPAKLLAAIQDPSKKDMLIELGILEAPRVQTGVPSKGEDKPKERTSPPDDTTPKGGQTAKPAASAAVT